MPRGNACPDCGGPHGRGYHTCPKPYANYVEPPLTPRQVEHRQAVEQYEYWLAEVDRTLGEGTAVKLVSLITNWYALEQFQ